MKYKIKIPNPPAIQKYRVYFDLETGKIEAITNKEIEGKTTFFETPIRDVEDFVLGNKNLTKHKVVFNVKDQEYNIIHDQESIIVYADDLIFEIKTAINPQIIITQDIKNLQWKVTTDQSIRTQMQDVHTRLEEVMYFSITENGNPNILYNHFYINIKDIIQLGTVVFPFTSQIEEDRDNISVYTNRKFDRYTHEVINE